MKRIIVVILIGIAVFFALPLKAAAPPAEKTIKQLFCEQVIRLMSVPEGSFTASAEIMMPSSSFGGGSTVSLLFGKTADLDFSLKGNFSERTGQAAMSLAASVGPSRGGSATPLTDIIVNGGNIYLNLKTVFDFLKTVYGSSIKYSSYFSADYINLAPGDLGAFSLGLIPLDPAAPAMSPKFTALEARVLGVIADALKEEYFSTVNGSLTLTLGSAAFQNVAKAVLSDAGTNAGVYADAIIELQSKSPGYLNAVGMTAENIRITRDDLVLRIEKSSIKEISELGNLSDINVTASISRDSISKTYNLDFSLEGVKENLKIAFNLKLDQNSPKNVSAPEKSMDIESVMKELEVGGKSTM